MESQHWSLRLRPLRVEAGKGSVERVPELVDDLHAQRVLIVSDEGIRRAGHVERVRNLLSGAAGDRVTEVFSDVEENPTESCVARGADAARAFEPDCIVGLGGGSAMDCAKGINFVHTNGGRMADYWGFGKATRPMLPSVGIPCSTGTGSEAQSFALISRDGDHVKMACGDDKARFRSVILDPDLAATQPREVFALAALDAVSHAVEAYVTRSRNPVSRLFAGGAWDLLSAAVPRLGDLEPGSPRDGAEHAPLWLDLLVGAHLAGAAIETSMLGAAHGLANPLTARYGVPHGAAVALVLPTVVRWNAEAVGERYADLEVPGGGTGAEAVAVWVERWSRRLGADRHWTGVAPGHGELAELAAEAAAQWTARHNPRPVDEVAAAELYQRALATSGDSLSAATAG